MGTTLREVVEEIGGGIPNGKKFKAAQTGGPSGGCIPAEHFDIPIYYDNLVEIGSMMGSGGLIVMDEDNCMVDIAKFFLEFTVDESCGKCTPCREGTYWMNHITRRIVNGKANMDDITLLDSVARQMQGKCLCALGEFSTMAVTSGIEKFRADFEQMVKK
jgi:NADP-reducing hydrogenase subunit HndC